MPSLAEVYADRDSTTEYDDMGDTITRIERVHCLKFLAGAATLVGIEGNYMEDPTPTAQLYFEPDAPGNSHAGTYMPAARKLGLTLTRANRTSGGFMGKNEDKRHFVSFQYAEGYTMSDRIRRPLSDEHARENTTRGAKTYRVESAYSRKSGEHWDDDEHDEETWYPIAHPDDWREWEVDIYRHAFKSEWLSDHSLPMDVREKMAEIIKRKNAVVYNRMVKEDRLPV